MPQALHFSSLYTTNYTNSNYGNTVAIIPIFCYSIEYILISVQLRHLQVHKF